MNISALSSSFSISQLTGSSQSNGLSRPSDADFGPPPTSGGPGGPLMGAIAQALSKIGAIDGSATTSSNSTSSTGSSDSSSNTTQDPAQALASFMQSLMAALHSQSAGSSGNSSDADGDSDSTQAASGVNGGHHHHGGAGKIESDLQSLIQSLSSSTSDTSSTGQASSTSTDTVDAKLQQSFSDLMKSLGDNNSNATLQNFLQALQSNMQNFGSAGNVVDTKV